MSGHNLAGSIALCVAVLCVVVLGALVSKPADSTPEISIQSSDITKSLEEEFSKRKIIAFEETRPGEVKYTYYGDSVPEAITPDEVSEMRTENSYTRFVSSSGEGSSERYRMKLVSYPQPTFKKDEDGAWKYIEHSTTTKEAMSNRPRSYQDIFADFFGKPALATTGTFYSGAGDGYISSSTPGFGGGGGTWSSVHDAIEGAADSTYTQLYVGVGSGFSGGNYIQRTFLPFDTSAIPSSAPIFSASLSVYVLAKSFPDDDGNDFITVVQTSQATHTTLASADYDQCGAISNPTEGIDSGQRKDISSGITTPAYLTFTLNSTGLGWIAKNGVSSNCSGTTGITCLGLREGHDVLNDAGGGDDGNAIQVYSSEDAGTSRDPYLTIIYDFIPSPTMRGLIKGARLKFNGGRTILKSNENIPS